MSRANPKIDAAVGDVLTCAVCGFKSFVTPQMRQDRLETGRGLVPFCCPKQYGGCGATLPEPEASRG